MKNVVITLALLFLISCSNPRQEAQQFIDAYTQEYVGLAYASAQGQWITNTQIKEGDTTNAYNSKLADEGFTAFTGSINNIEKVRKFLEQQDMLTPLQVKQLKAILYLAASDPQTVPDLVKEKIKADIAQTEKLFGFAYSIEGKPVTANDIDAILKQENALNKRLAAWSASKEVGRELKEGLVNLRRLRNETVKALNYSDYYSYQVSDYGLSTEDMMEMMQRLNQELRPLYRELHTYARYEFAKKYGVKEVPDYLPAHWLPNRWGQDWTALVDVKGLNTDSALATKSPEWIVKEGEAFYKSLGFEALPESFWVKSNLYPYPADSVLKKNNHASAWHLDLDHDVRSLMSVESNSEWFETSNHELGHIYYFLTYTNPDVPPLMRGGANRAFHEAIGSMMGMAAMQKPYLIGRGLIKSSSKTDSIQLMLKEALQAVVFIPFAAGTMSEFEKSLYADNLSESEFNKKWWELVKKYQGIVPPTERGEEFCDAATKTHINNDPAQYYDYALSSVILFQLHQHIAEKILKQDPRATNYFGNQEVGNFLKSIMTTGSTKDWRDVLKDATGEEMNAKAIVRYFDPLLSWLKEQNKGRKYTMPEGLE